MGKLRTPVGAAARGDETVGAAPPLTRSRIHAATDAVATGRPTVVVVFKAGARGQTRITFALTRRETPKALAAITYDIRVAARNRDVPDMLELVDLTKSFGEVVTLAGLSPEVRPGCVLGFLVPNGAGKTTAMRSCSASSARTAARCACGGVR